MKYLLVGINAKYIHSNLALHCLRSYAQKYSGVVPVIREYTINMPISDIIQGIYDESPDFIGMSVYIWNSEITMQVVRDIKKLLPNTIIYLGGPEVSFESENILNQYPEANGIMLGEGEQTFLELINHYDNINDLLPLSEISGLCYRDDSSGEIITTTVRKPIDLSTLPFPYENLSDFANKIIYYETSRGCPFGCSYCLSSVDKSLRFRSMDLVKKEFLFFLGNKVPQVKLVDRTFNIDHKRSLEMLKFLKENDNGITNFHFEIAGDILTDAEIDMINSLRPGLIQLEIGVQSTNPCTLEAINRHTDLDKLRTNVSGLLEGGKVHLHLDLIAGLPYEGLDSFIDSFNEVYSMHSHELQLGFLKVLKGAPINAMKSDQEIKHSSYAPYEVFSTKYLSYENICELKRVEEMLEIYHNSCQFVLSEQFLLNLERSPYEMYLGLAKYYVNQNQLVIQCKRSVRYELLLSYATERFNLSEEQINELRTLLTLDYYSREKAKARPAFAPSVDNCKAILRKMLDNISNENPSGQYHIEPINNGQKYAVFDYSRRSVITGNIEIEYVE